jgi:D-amino-acid oxidase
VDFALANRIAERCIELAPELTNGKGVDALDIISHNVGLRPTRVGGARLEIEYMDGVGLVLHNYGTKCKIAHGNGRCWWSRISE